MKEYRTNWMIFFDEGDLDKAEKMKRLLEEDYDIEYISISKGFFMAKKEEPRLIVTTTSKEKNKIIKDFHLEKKLGWRNGYIY